MQCISGRGIKVRAFVKLVVLASVSAAIPGFGQTAADLAGKYPAVSAYEVRPGVLLTAKYAENGQVCELVLEARHYQTPGKVEFSSIIPPKLEDSLIDELVPMAERGEPKHRWSNKEPKDAWVDPDSFSAGGVSYVKRSYENVTVEEHGYYTCHENPHSTKSKDKLDCSEGGDEVVVIRWTQRTCATSKAAGLGQMVPAGSGAVTAGNVGKDKGETEAGQEAGAGGSPEGDGLSALSGEKFLPLDSSEGQGVGNPAEVRGQDKIRGAGAQSGAKATASQRAGDTASKSADALNRKF